MGAPDNPEIIAHHFRIKYENAEGNDAIHISRSEYNEAEEQLKKAITATQDARENFMRMHLLRYYFINFFVFKI